MVYLLARFLHGFIRWAPKISLFIAVCPIVVVLPLTWLSLKRNGCTVLDFQVDSCPGASYDTIQALNNGLTFSLWGLVITIPVAIALHFGMIWVKYMLEIYLPVKKGNFRPPLYPGEPPRER